MKTIRFLLTICFLMLLADSPALAQKYSSVKIVPPGNTQQRAELLGLLEIDHFDIQEGGIIAEISDGQLARLQHSNYQYQILVPDVAANVKELNRQYFSASPSARVAMEQPG